MPVTCSVNAAAPAVRSSGTAERVGDLVVDCTGGAPAPAGQVVPPINVTLTLNTAVTSRQFTQGWSEALLLIDDPPASAQLACATANGVCPVNGTGTGTGTYNGTPGRPNIFQGRQAAANTVTWTGVPFDPPGQGTRRLRFVNLRANAAQLGANAAVQATLTSSAAPLSFSATVANVQGSVSAAVKNATMAGGQLSGFTLELSEAHAAVFRTRTGQGAAAANQNTPGGAPPGAESGFVNQQLPATSRGDLSLAGLADSGLRVLIRLNNVPAQAVISAPLAVDFGNGGRLQLASTDADGAGAFTPAASSTLPNTNGSVTAVYEFTAASATALETVNIPISIAYSSPPPSPLQRLSGDISLAPLSPNSVPRFVNQIPFEAAAPAALNITTASLPGGAAGASYSQQIQAAGGTPPYTFSSDTALPPGLSLSPQGVLSGTPLTAGAYTFTVRVTDSAGASATRGFTLTVSSASGPLVLSSAQVALEAIAGGGFSAMRNVSVLAAGSSPVEFRVAVDEGPGTPAPGWLIVMPRSGTTPGNLIIGANPAGLAEGIYTARIRVMAGSSEQIVTVTLRVTSAPPKLEAAPGLITGAARVNDPRAFRELLHLRNGGGGDPIPFSIEVAAGGSWITRVEPAAGLARAQPSTAVRIDIDTTGLPAGFYRNELLVTWAGGVLRVPVVLFVAPAEPVMDLNLKGLRFMTRSGQRSSVIKSFKVLNRDPLSTLNWSAEVVRGDEWLMLLPARGTAALGSPGLVRVALKPSVANLAPGPRFGLIRVSSPTALTSPLYVVVVLYVVPDQAAARLDFDPAGAVLISTPGAQRPVTREFQVGANSTTPVEFQASAATNEGGDWLTVSPASGTVSADDNGGEGIRITVSASSARLARGVYTGEVVVASQGTVTSLAITFIVADSAAEEPAPAGVRAAGCTPSKLAVTPTGPFNNFNVPAGWPEALVVDLRDDCGQPVEGASVVASFSNGDPPLTLRADGDSGAYSADWQPGAPADNINIVIRARGVRLKKPRPRWSAR